MLDQPKHEQVLREIWRYMRLEKSYYDLLCQPVLETLAQWCQAFPASADQHHSYDGGLLDHSLDVIRNALRLRQSYYISADTSRVYEKKRQEDDLWTYFVFLRAAFHDIGRVPCNIVCETCDHQGENTTPWLFLSSGPLDPTHSECYVYHYENRYKYTEHLRMSSFLADRYIPEFGRNWLVEQDCYIMLLNLISEITNQPKTVHDIVKQADVRSAKKAQHDEQTAVHKKNVYDVYADYLKRHPALSSNGHYVIDNTYYLPKAASEGFFTGLMDDLIAEQVIKESIEHDQLVQLLAKHDVLIATSKKAQPKKKGEGHKKAVIIYHSEHTIEKNETDVYYRLTHIGTPDDSQAGFRLKQPNEHHLPGLEKHPEPRSNVQNETGPTTTMDQLMNEIKKDVVQKESTPMAKTNPAVDDKKVISKTNTPTNTAITGVLDQIIESNDTTPIGEILKRNPNTDIPLGDRFWAWVVQEIETEQLPINQPDAPVHRVEEGLLLVSPEIFNRFQQSGETRRDYVSIQNSLWPRNYHRLLVLGDNKQKNVIPYRVKMTRSRLNGVVIKPSILPPWLKQTEVNHSIELFIDTERGDKLYD